MLRSILLLVSLLMFGSAAQAQILETFKKPAAEKPATGPSASEIERATWQACASARTASPCEVYLRKYPRGGYASIAQTKIEDLTRAQQAAPQAPVRQAPAPVVQVDREPRLWAACEAGTTVSPCADYLGSYPSGRWSDNARTRISALNAAAAEKSAFAQCQASAAPGPCETFIATYPSSNLVAAAKAQSTVIAAQSAQRAAAEKEQAAQQAANARAEAARREAAEKEQAAQREANARAQAAADQDKRAFAACEVATTASPCEAYLASFPTGVSVGAARLKISNISAAEGERSAAAVCLNGSSASLCEKYLANYPTGASAAAARSRIAALNAADQERAAWALCQNSDSALPCERYIATYPSGSSVDAARALVAKINGAEQEKTAWAQCDASKTVFPCEKYLTSFPTGRFAEAARTKIKVLETAETEPEAVLALGLVVKRTDKGELQVVSVQQFSSAMGNVFGGDVIIKINDQPTDPRVLPRAALENGLATGGGRVKLLIRRGPAAVSVVVRARP